jgi:hypothetical protein
MRTERNQIGKQSMELRRRMSAEIPVRFLSLFQTSRLRKHGQMRRQRKTVFARQTNIEKDSVWPQLDATAQS